MKGLAATTPPTDPIIDTKLSQEESIAQTFASFICGWLPTNLRSLESLQPQKPPPKASTTPPAGRMSDEVEKLVLSQASIGLGQKSQINWKEPLAFQKEIKHRIHSDYLRTGRG
jgi:hypothetical protein